MSFPSYRTRKGQKAYTKKEIKLLFEEFHPAYVNNWKEYVYHNGFLNGEKLYSLGGKYYYDKDIAQLIGSKTKPSLNELDKVEVEEQYY